MLAGSLVVPFVAVVAACTSSRPSGSPSGTASGTNGATDTTDGGDVISGPGYRLHRDVTYAPPVGRGHLLDVYVPTDGRGPYPVVIYQAGSAWTSDDTKGSSGGASDGGADDSADGSADSKESGLDGSLGAATLARRWAPRAWAVVGLNVRSSSQAHFPAQVYDVKAAIRYLRANAATFDLDADRMATMGTSSGGWVATMAGVTADVPSLDGDLGNAGVSSRVAAVVDLFGPTDFLQMDDQRLPDGQRHDGADSPESMLMGFPIQSDADAVRAADPVTYVNAGSPPVWIAHGLVDPQVPHQQSELLYTAYRQAGATATLTLVPGVGHTATYLASADDSTGRTVQQTSGGTSTDSDSPAPTYDAIFAFLSQHLST